MKKTEGGNGLFGGKFSKGNEPKVRYVERQVKLPFLADSDPETDTNYGRIEDTRSEWGLSDKDASLKSRRRRTYLSLAAAFVILAAIFTLIFYVLPTALPSFFKGSSIELFVEPDVNLEYSDASYRVVCEVSVNVMSKPNVKSDTITQILYNEPVTVTSNEPVNGYIKIETADGNSGYIPEDSVISDMTSVEPDLHEYKLVVSDLSKNIMTHASNGTLIKKVMMNTVLYADVKREGVYQVYLPGGGTGWIGSSGVVEVTPRGTVGKVVSRYFVGSLLLFVNATYMENGLTMNGISINGAVYVCSEINGVDMPRTMQGQATTGHEVDLAYDAVSGNVDLNSIEKGDILFFSSSEGSTTISEMAVCTDTGTFLMKSTAGTTVRLRSFDADDEIFDRIVTIRRVFDAED